MIATARCHRYLLALGSNLGDRQSYLRLATAQIEARIGPVRDVSPCYATAPVGAADQTFLNAALTATSDLLPPAVLSILLAIEGELGRVRRERWGNRVIDLDLLLWQQRDEHGHWRSASWQSPELQVPHPQMLLRDFVMVPAVAVAADWLHPSTQLSLAASCTRSGYSLLPLNADAGMPT